MTERNINKISFAGKPLPVDAIKTALNVVEFSEAAYLSGKSTDMNKDLVVMSNGKGGKLHGYYVTTNVKKAEYIFEYIKSAYEYDEFKEKKKEVKPAKVKAKKTKAVKVDPAAKTEEKKPTTKSKKEESKK